MPYVFEFDNANALLQGRLFGVVSSQDLREYFRNGIKCVTAKKPRAGITDLSGVTSFEANSQTIRDLASARPVASAENLLRVIVAPTPDVFGMARMFESHGEATRPNLHVVKTCKEAFAIVGVQEPHFETIDLNALNASAESAGTD
ncbi:MAG TPA: hypothetical protein VGD60_12895 [Candidatus Acidoferrales bacterium]